MNLCWLRRDLRLHDNAALYHALRSGETLLVFIFDRQILDALKNPEDARVNFIFDEVVSLKEELQKMGSDIDIWYGEPSLVWKDLVEEYKPQKVFWNRDYEPYAKERDGKVQTFLTNEGVQCAHYKDHVIFEADEVLKNDGSPYTVFTPYKRKWLAKLSEDISDDYFLKSYPCEKYYANFKQLQVPLSISLEKMGFKPSKIPIPSKVVKQSVIRNYDKTRDFPAEEGTSKLGIHYRFGTISIREKARKAAELNEMYLNELIWRDFYSQILDHFPKVVHTSFREKYEAIEWRNEVEDFEKWCAGMTGYPIVDAGMRELNATGYMHNRVRMIAASFLTKHLLIDWRWGEQYFAEKLLDFELASNNGGWQWAAGCGTDAAPYFRIFNPYTQADKFDKNRIYIRKWIPEVDTDTYPSALVEHKYARQRCLDTYKFALSK